MIFRNVASIYNSLALFDRSTEDVCPSAGGGDPCLPAGREVASILEFSLIMFFKSPY